MLDGQEVGGHLLDSGEKVGGHLVDCGWLKEGTHKLSDLQSKVCYTSFVKIRFYNFIFEMKDVSLYGEGFDKCIFKFLSFLIPSVQVKY